MDIELTKLTTNDLEGVHVLWSDEAATLFTNFPYLATLDECRQRLEKMMAFYGQCQDHFGPFVVRAGTGEFLGLAGGDVSVVPGEYEIWYFIRRDMWGKKIATTAVATLLELMKGSGRVQSIKAEAVVDNESSWRFLEKLGFERTGILPDAHKKNDRTWNRYVYSKAIL